jgi:hypothetical protein
MRSPVPVSALAISAVAALALAAPLAAQATATHADHAAPAAALPAGWQLRLDRPSSSGAVPRFVAMGDGYHVTSGPAAIFWSPAVTATVPFRAEASFRQTRAPAHPEAYGLLLGGRDLSGPAQDYLYFLVRQDGQFMISHRAGNDVHSLVPWTAHPAVQKADSTGQATNVLRVDAAADSVRFAVNGKQVMALPPGVGTAGLIGLRVNHNLDVHVGRLTVTPAARK